MRNLVLLIRFYFSTFYALPAIKESQGKISAKSILKLAGIIVLALYMLSTFGFLAWQIYGSLYKVFASVGIERLILVYALIYGSLYVLIIGFISSFSSVYTNEMEAYMATLPIKSVYLLSGKAAALSVTDFMIALLTMGSGFIVYGIYEQPSWLYYGNALLMLILATVLIIVLSYCISIPLLAMGRFFRNRDVTMVVMGFAAIVGVLYIQASMNRILTFTEKPEEIMVLLQGSNEAFLRLLDTLPPLRFILQTLLDASNPVFSLLLIMLIGVELCVAFLLFSLLSPLYRRVIQGFSEQYIKKMNRTQSAAYLRTSTGKRSPLMALLLRELRSMNREPVYFLNGPFIILLLPIVLGISLYFSVGNQASIQEISNAARKLITPVQQVLISIITGAFLGSATSITCTALSRDAKQLGYLKTLPVSPRLFLGAKLLHGSIFGFVGAIVAVGISSFLFQVDEPLLLLVLGASSVLSVLFNLLGLYIDTLNPALNWENPVAAMKQNINAVVMMLLEMLIFAGIGVGSFMWIHSMALLIIFLLALPLVLTLILLAVYFPLGEARLRRLEV